MGMWSEANARKTLRDRMGLGDGKVVRSLSEDEDFEDMGVWPATERLSRADRKAADKVLREGKPPRKSRGKKK